MSYRPTRSIEGTVAAITGASAGIGAATARALVGVGAKVALGARRNDRLASLVGELGDEHAVALPGDVRDPQYNEALVAAAVQKWGRLDTVVANAGIGAYGGILDIDDAQLREMVETNYLATVWTVRSGVRQFRAQGDGGDIVIVSSVAGFRGGADEAVYAGTKFAQEGLGGSLVFGIAAAVLSVEFLLGKPAWVGVPLGLMLVITGVLGDLVESQVKRDLGIKDMGSILPGHGGFMDRMDSLLLSAPVAWVVLTLFVPGA